jgi:hypothetical protein
MVTSKGNFVPPGLTMDYRQLGTINIDELAHAVIEDVSRAQGHLQCALRRKPAAQDARDERVWRAVQVAASERRLRLLYGYAPLPAGLHGLQAVGAPHAS